MKLALWTSQQRHRLSGFCALHISRRERAASHTRRTSGASERSGTPDHRASGSGALSGTETRPCSTSAPTGSPASPINGGSGGTAAGACAHATARTNKEQDVCRPGTKGYRSEGRVCHPGPSDGRLTRQEIGRLERFLTDRRRSRIAGAYTFKLNRLPATMDVRRAPCLHMRTQRWR